MKQLSKWLDEHIKKKELINNSFQGISPAAIKEYRDSRRMPKYEGYIKICDTLGINPTEKQYLKFKKYFKRNDKL